MNKIVLIIAMLLFQVGIANAQIEQPVKWSYAAKKLNDKEAVVFLKADLDKGWHIYSAYQPEGGPDKTSFKFAPSKDYTLVGKITEPKPIKKYEPVFEINVLYFENSVVFQQKIKLNKPMTVVSGKLSFQVCTNQKCLATEEVEFSVPIK